MYQMAISPAGDGTITWPYSEQEQRAKLWYDISEFINSKVGSESIEGFSIREELSGEKMLYTEAEWNRAKKQVIFMRNARTTGVNQLSKAQFRELLDLSLLMLEVRDRLIDIETLSDSDYLIEARYYGDSVFYVCASCIFQIKDLPGKYSGATAGGVINYYYFGMLLAKSGRLNQLEPDIRRWNELQGNSWFSNLTKGSGNPNVEKAQAEAAIPWAQFGAEVYRNDKIKKKRI
jgi:hypothetical protein